MTGETVVYQPMARIKYKIADGSTDTIERDEFHADTSEFLTAFNNSDEHTGVTHKVSIPLHRVVRIDEGDCVQQADDSGSDLRSIE